MNLTVDSPIFWNEIYKNNQAGWDLKSPNPVLLEIMNKKEFLQPCNILIPGCGKGYDAVTAAKLGYNVTAVDFSPLAISFAKQLAEKESANVKFLESDIFKITKNGDEGFDAIYDYTSYCAINPERREEYAKKLSDLLKPNGKLIAHLFPVEDRKGGPPFGIDVNDTFNIFSKYFQLHHSTKKINSIKPRKGREVLQVYIKQ